MSTYSSGAQRDLYYVIEDSFGSGPTVLNMSEIRNSDDSLSLSRDSFVSDERRGDRGIHDLRLGNKQPAGDVGFEFSYSSFNDFLPIALCSDLVANGLSSTNITATIDATTGILTAAAETFVTDGYEAGDQVVMAGWDDAGNNGTFNIIAVTETTMTLSPITNMVTVAVAEADVDLTAYSAWAKPYSDLSVSVTADATADTFTRASGSWIDDGVRVGDVITTTTFDVAPGNNMTTQVTALTALVMTVSGSLTTAIADVGVFNTTAREIKKGSTTRSLVIEKAFSDIAEYQKYVGGIINTMSMELNSNAMITGSFGMMFKDVANAQIDYADSTASTGTDRPFDGFTGYINENDTENAEISSLSFSLDNGFERNFVLMSNTAPQMTSGKSNVNGSVTMYFDSQTVYDKFVNETESSLEVGMQDDDLNGYVVTFPRIKYTSADVPVNSDSAVVNTMNFQALDDSTEASNIIIRRQPKAS